MFATDRDLLTFEPNLFSDISWSGQRLLSATGASIDSTGLILTLAGATFDDLGITTGHVILIDSVPAEVTARLSATQLAISRPRASSADDPIPLIPTGSASITITSFRSQIHTVHAQILRTIGIDPDDDTPPNESDITTPGRLVRLESLGALHLIMSAAAVHFTHDEPLWTKAGLYRNRFINERGSICIKLDLNGDGIADTTRRPGVGHMVRR